MGRPISEVGAAYLPKTVLAMEFLIVFPPFIAGRAGRSDLYATGTPKNGGTEGRVFGNLRGKPFRSTPITEAGLSTIDGKEVLIVRFQANGQPWEARYNEGTIRRPGVAPSRFDQYDVGPS